MPMLFPIMARRSLTSWVRSALRREDSSSERRRFSERTVSPPNESLHLARRGDCQRGGRLGGDRLFGRTDRGQPEMPVPASDRRPPGGAATSHGCRQIRSSPHSRCAREGDKSGVALRRRRECRRWGRNRAWPRSRARAGGAAAIRKSPKSQPAATNPGKLLFRVLRPGTFPEPIACRHPARNDAHAEPWIHRHQIRGLSASARVAAHSDGAAVHLFSRQ